MPVAVAWTAPRRTVRCATDRHGGRCMPPHASGCAVPRHVPLGVTLERRVGGELERSPEVAVCRGKWLAVVAVFLRLIACRPSGLAGAHGAPWRAPLVVPGFRPSRQAPLAGVLVFCLVYFALEWSCTGSAVPASSSCRGLASLARQAPLAGGFILARQAPLAGGFVLDVWVFSWRFPGRPLPRGA